MRLAVVVVAVASLIGACSSDDPDAGSAATTTTVAAGPVDPSCPPFHGTTSPLATSGDRPEALLVDASVETVGCLDRVSFEFESLGDGTPPGYRVGYRDVAAEPLVDANGNVFTVPGNAFLLVTIAPAASNDPRVEEQPATYRGNLRLSYGEVHHIESVQKLPDALGTVQWVIGLDGERPFVVDSAAGPPRIGVYIG